MLTLKILKQLNRADAKSTSSYFLGPTYLGIIISLYYDDNLVLVQNLMLKTIHCLRVSYSIAKFPYM